MPFTLYCFPLSSLFSTFYIFFFSYVIGIKQDYDHLHVPSFPSCAWPGFLSAHTSIHPSFQGASVSSTSCTAFSTLHMLWHHMETYMYMYVGHICRLFSCFINLRPCHAQASSFSTTPDKYSWSSLGALVLSTTFTYFLPSWLLWAFGLTTFL